MVEVPDPAPVPHRAGSRSIVWLWLLIGFVAALLLSSTALLLDTQLSRHEVRQMNAQPATPEFSYGGPYYVGVVQRRSWLLSRQLPDEVWVSRYPDLSYGHSVRLDITGVDSLVFDDVQWLQDGVRVHFPSGHEIVVPAKSFVGGR